MIRILSNTSFVSARILAEELRTIGEKCFSTRRPERISSRDLVIRYGSTDLHEGIDTLNTLEVIRTCSNKLNFSQLMQEEKIYSPIFYKGVPKESQYPVIVRTTLNSYGGKGMILVENSGDFHYSNVWWTPFIQTQFELRVHVLGGKIIRMFKKEDGESYIRTSNNGWHFSLKENKDYPKVSLVVQKICEIPRFANAFFALDLGWDSKKKQYLVFEANSAPGLNEHTANLYAQYILNKINTTYR
jgi:glutathione synthase/RimK-type ligase-like ATP-grasp enzyme